MIPQNARCDNPRDPGVAVASPTGPEITLSEPADLATVERRWLELEPRANGSFFQSWAWVGCLGAERFDDPLLLEARRDGDLVAMALFNRRRRWPAPTRLWLGESGVPTLDAVFVEHNGLLVAQTEGAAPELLADSLRVVLATGGALTLSGVGDGYLPGAGSGTVAEIRQRRLAPYVDLAVVRHGGYLSQLSANARYQLRRSAKAYGSHGPLRVHRAESAMAAIGYFDAMGVLHQRTWVRRGRAGAFANPDFVRFHHALIQRAHDQGGADLLRVTAGERVIGYLYNLRHRGRVSAYQSGFDYDAAGPHQKPGLTCHHQAIEHYLGETDTIYDFLAGEDRYKTSLSTGCESLYWIDLARRRSLAGVYAGARSWLRRARGSGSQITAGNGQHRPL